MLYVINASDVSFYHSTMCMDVVASAIAQCMHDCGECIDCHSADEEAYSHLLSLESWALEIIDPLDFIEFEVTDEMLLSHLDNRDQWDVEKYDTDSDIPF